MSHKGIYALMFAVSVCLAVLLPAGNLNTGSIAFAQSSAGQTEIRSLLEAQQEAWNRGDIDAFMAGYWKSDKTEFVGAGGIIRGWQAVMDRYRKSYPDRAAIGKLAFSDLQITMLCPDSAYILGRWQLERASDRPGGVFTLVARKFPEGWRIVHDHTSAFSAPGSSGHE